MSTLIKGYNLYVVIVGDGMVAVLCAKRKKLKLVGKQDDGDIRTKGRMREGGEGIQEGGHWSRLALGQGQRPEMSG
jgi:hypothetical protein